jgi:hypothetical protein
MENEEIQTEKVEKEFETPVEEAKKVMEALKFENDRREKLLQAEEVERALSGSSDAGQVPEVKNKEFSDIDYAKSIAKGVIPE